MIQLGDQPCLVAKRPQRIFGHVLVVRHFQRDPDSFDRIEHSINSGKPSQSQPLFDSILTDVLSRFEQCLASLR